MGATNMNRRHAVGFLRAFSLIELVIVVVIIAIIGAIAIPKMSRGAAGAGDSALIQNLAVMRKAIELYNAEHPNAPLTASSDVTSALTLYSDANGTTASAKSSTIIYGPYIKSIPALPVGTTNKGNTAIGTSAGSTLGAAGNGWFFNGTDIQANTGAAEADVSGKLYTAY
jgi:general secretion pathway protein G